MIKAVVFDLDGTIVDNMKFHQEAFLGFLNSKGVPLTINEYISKYQGHSNKENFSAIFGKELLRDELVSFTDEKEEVYRRMYRDVKAVDGFLMFSGKREEWV